MPEYMITLAIETDTAEGHPAHWDWAELLDTPYAVAVVKASDVSNTHTAAALLIHASDMIARAGESLREDSKAGA